MAEYGINVAGDRAGVVGTCGSEAGHDSDVEGVGVHGSGNTIGVFGKTVSGGIARVAGVYGQDNQGKTGVLGAVMRGGTAVAGVNVSSLGNPLATFNNLPNPGDGNGTGVYGTSGSGIGVHGTSNTGWGVHGISTSNTAVFASSDSGFGAHGKSTSNTGIVGESDTGWGVHGISTSNTAVFASSDSGFGAHGKSTSNTGIVGESDTGWGVHGISTSNTAVFASSDSGFGAHGKSTSNTGIVGESDTGIGGVFESQQAAPIRLIPKNLESPEGQINGNGGELLVTTTAGESGDSFALWFCARGGDAASTVWELVVGTRPYPGTLIAEGAQGITVKRIQLQLNLVAAAGLVVDGIFGPQTRQAVIDFQNAQGIGADGIVGPVTWEKLFAVV